MVSASRNPFPATVSIPAGSFLMGAGLEGAPVRRVTLDAFTMDDRPITNHQFKAFLKACPEWQKTAAIAAHHNPYYLYPWRQEIIFPQGKRDHPVVYVSWYAAAAYCNWRSREENLQPCYDEGNDFACDFSASGYRLPTEAEYEYAARGGLEGKLYPWGDDIDKSRANFDNLVGDTTEAGSYPPNGYGLYDMAGNVGHWCQDWYAPVAPGDAAQRNPHGPETGTHKIYKGGAWGTPAAMQRCACRSWLLPANCNPDFGFRCVRAGS
ncbi:MAG: SUMF1/EgtB/PvdO family nonheme iron enzyme [Alphaproteobacteria bacterium]|nr:SUMF1/EgtB/PvdO family nonheme iron enzyme [Alphaproteobacteria bacterium]